MGSPGIPGPSIWSGRPGDLPPEAPTDPYVSLSAHTALLTQSSECHRPAPLREQSGATFCDRGPPRLGSFERCQPFVLLASPPQDVGVDPADEGQHRGPVEPAVIVEPPAHDREALRSAWLTQAASSSSD